ncbi:AbrB family transcriptional regulator [Rhizobium halophytocola]|uniref:Membrane AbrB-like protein n=1 Tax=Rhizobium halophytocola TaxID=735519 RepID=A0ABS4DYR7_9HYPH|nr:AbrB family transcriptional regulator [Rhizobium halophytocola]MBP1850830.1 membrane AbrB-like protein [Rhizobium halophytocola]
MSEPVAATTAASETKGGLLTHLPVALRWAILVIVSGAAGTVFELMHLPAGLLLGPMIAAILVATNGARLSLPRKPYIAAQALIGTMIAQSLDGAILKRVAEEWYVFGPMVVSIVAVSATLGYVLARRQVLPGTTAVWGTSAGAASAMVLMAEAYGADARLVAFMQYLRVVCVASAAALMAAFVFNVPDSGQTASFDLFPPVDWIALLVTLVATAVLAYAGNRLRIPAATMLTPMIGMALLHSLGILPIELPPWLLALAYAMIGWRIGLAFTRRLLRHAARALPQVLLSIGVLIGFGGLLAFLLWALVGVDPLTAYLATSPGGLDSIAIIASSTHVDVPFVLALQTCRFLLILAVGPTLSRFVAKRFGTAPAA